MGAGHPAREFLSAMSRGRRIARIKLVPPSSEAVEQYLLEWDPRTLYHHPQDFPQLTSEHLFRRGGPMVLEIGCGTGEFLLNSAASQPEERFIGVEISRRAIYHAVNQAEELALTNIKFIKADIRLLYPLMAPGAWSAVHLLFPDPNYAAGRRKHRILSPEFLDIFYTALAPNGTINAVTDQHPFLLDMLKIAESDPRFTKTHPERYLEGFTPPQKTRVQSSWERLNRINYRFELELSPQT
jgi:tRNA (guanine-N7-)-methyltransferase